MRTTWKRQNSIGNCPAKKFRDFRVIAMAVEISSSSREKKIHRVDNPFSGYYKKAMCDLEIYLRRSSGEITPTDVQSRNLTANVKT